MSKTNERFLDPCRTLVETGISGRYQGKKSGKEINVRYLPLNTRFFTPARNDPSLLIGYAWVSTHDQKLHLQKDALKQARDAKSLHAARGTRAFT